VVSYLDVLQRKVTLGKRVAIIGARVALALMWANFCCTTPRWRLPVSIEHWCQEWGVDLQASPTAAW
jgi:2,4-dienoyl-CoA reductase (NADPH2)